MTHMQILDIINYYFDQLIIYIYNKIIDILSSIITHTGHRMFDVHTNQDIT